MSGSSYGTTTVARVGVVRRRVLVACVLTVAVLLESVGLAAASRAPTPAERRALAAALGMPAGCITARISNKAARPWARVSPTNSRGCPGANGVVVFQREARTFRWRLAYQGPAGRQLCPVRPIPTAVALDLNLCLQPSRMVFVANPFRLVSQPRTLIFGAHAALVQLRWSRWGTATTTASGVLDYADRYERFRLPVRVTLTRIGFCNVNHRTYLRQTIAATRTSDRRRLAFATGTTQLDCPPG